MINPAFFNPYFLLVAVGVICTSAGLGYAKGLTNGLDRLADFKAEVAAANATVATENRLKIEQAEQTTREVAELYVRYADGIARDYVSRLERVRRDAGNRCAAVPAVAESARVVDGLATDAGPDSPAYASVCQRLEADCADTTGKLIFLQDWVRRVCQ